jgi:hypothetical protein
VKSDVARLGSASVKLATVPRNVAPSVAAMAMPVAEGGLTTIGIVSATRAALVATAVRPVASPIVMVMVNVPTVAKV